MRHMLRLATVAVLVALLVIASFVAGFATAQANVALPVPGLGRTPPADLQKQFGVFWEAWNIVQREFVDRSKLDPQHMTYGAIQGMLQSLGDPYTAHVDRQHYELETKDLQGSFSGIGATVSIENKQLVVVAPIDGSPAQKAGLKPGTVILAIDGQETAKMTLLEAVSKIRGPRGTTVRLAVLFPGQTKPQTIEIVRDDIKTPSVSAKLLPDSDIGYLRITEFTARTNDEVVDALHTLRQAGAKRLVVDLRRNPGGYLESVVNVTSQFLKDGVVLYQVDKDGKRSPYPVRRGGQATDLPLAVLVDKGSASASEIFAGAVQDAGRGVIIGEETFGKGTVTQFFPLSDGSAINVAIGRWLTPKGHLIEGKGIAPDIPATTTDDDVKAGRDPALDRAVQYLKTGQ